MPRIPPYRAMRQFLISPAMAALALFLGGMTAPAADAPATFKVSDVTFQRPEKWEWVATQSQMRKAQLKVPNPVATAEAGEVVFFHFGPGNGGGTQANINRWFSQFEGDRASIKGRTEEAKVGDSKVTYVFAEGTYKSGMPGGPQTPKPGFALAGAILEDPSGHIFVRLTGPKALVDSAANDFKALIASGKR